MPVQRDVRRILVADDDELLREEIVDVLQTAGYDVVGASNGVCALRLLRERAVDLVVADLNMPLLDGDELQRELADNPALSAIPVLVISAERSARTSDVDSFAFLGKPFDSDALESAVAELLSKRHARKITPDASLLAPLGPKPPSPRAIYAAGDVFATRYRLVQLLGEGGMGEVWLARHLVLDTDVALKLIRRDVAQPLALELLLREARAVARLDHPHIVRVSDFGETEARDPFIVMELLKGETLESHLDRCGSLPPIEAVRLLLPVASALECAHAKGVVHRDLKPDNIVLSADETGKTIPKVVDFGVAKLRQDEDRAAALTGGVIVGSPDYMSPEQASGAADLDGRSDVWSLAVIAYEAVTGRRPFVGETLLSQLACILSEEPAATTDHGAGDEAFWQILKAGLEKDPASRWATMRDFGRALAEWAIERGVETDVAGGLLRERWFSQPPPPSAEEVAPAASLLNRPTPVKVVGPDADVDGDALTIPPSAIEASASEIDDGSITTALPLVRITARSSGDLSTGDGWSETPSRPRRRGRRWLRGLALVSAVALCGAWFTHPQEIHGLVEQLRAVGAAASDNETAAGEANPPAQTSSPSEPSVAMPATASAHVASAPPELGTCALPLFAQGTFAAGAPTLADVCSETDARRGASAIRAAVVRARGSSVATDGMREWAILGWYEMAAFAVLQGRCCPESTAIRLPASAGTCEPLDAPLNALAAAVKPEAAAEGTRQDQVLRVERALERYTAAVKCAMKTGTAGEFLFGPLRGGEEGPLRRMLERALGQPLSAPAATVRSPKKPSGEAHHAPGGDAIPAPDEAEASLDDPNG